MKGDGRGRDLSLLFGHHLTARHDAGDIASAELNRVLRDHSRRRREYEAAQQDPTILIYGLVVVSILFAIGWVTLDRMHCDVFYSDEPRLLRHLSCP